MTKEQEEEFDKFVLNRGMSDSNYVQLNYGALKNFISNLLLQDRLNLIKEIKGMKKTNEEHYNFGEQRKGYNQAIEDIIKKLKL